MKKLIILISIITLSLSEISVFSESLTKDWDNPNFYDINSQDQEWLNDAKKSTDIEIKEQKKYKKKIDIKLDFNKQKRKNPEAFKDNEKLIFTKFQENKVASMDLKWWGMHFGYAMFGSIGSAQVGENYTLLFDDYNLYHENTVGYSGFETDLKIFFVRVGYRMVKTTNRFVNTPKNTLLTIQQSLSFIDAKIDFYTIRHHVFGVAYGVVSPDTALTSDNIKLSKNDIDLDVSFDSVTDMGVNYYLYYIKDNNFGLYYALKLGMYSSLDAAGISTKLAGKSIVVVHNSSDGDLLKAAPFAEFSLGYSF